MITDTARFALNILTQFYDEGGKLPQSTNDLSPLELWLILKMAKQEETLIGYISELEDSTLNEWSDERIKGFLSACVAIKIKTAAGATV